MNTILTTLGLAGVGTALATAFGLLGPAVLAGGPLGVIVAWFGAKAASRTVRLVAILGGLALVAGVIIAITLELDHWKRDADALPLVKAELAHERATRAAIEEMLGCGGRIEAERELGACLAAQRSDADRARAAELDRQRKEAAAAQAKLDADNGLISTALNDSLRAIGTAEASDDGPVPKVLRDAWARDRARRGVK